MLGFLVEDYKLVHIKPDVALSIMIQQGASPLYLACQEGHDDVVQLLLNGGARIDLPAKVLYRLASSA